MKQSALLALALLLACASPVFAGGMDLSTNASEFMRGQRPLDAGLGWGNGPASGMGAESPDARQQAIDDLYEDLMREEELNGNGAQPVPLRMGGQGGGTLR